MATEILVDSHVHVAGTDEVRYPRNPTGAGSDWWRRECGVENLRQEMDSVGVQRAVVVQAVGVYGYDCTYAAEVVAADPERLSLVVAIDMAGPDPLRALSELLAGSPVAGVRLFGVGASGSEWLTNGRGDEVWRRAAEDGFVIVPTIFPAGLVALRALMEEHPEVTVALDHCAFPDLGGPGARTDLLEMADLPGLHLKVTSHNLDRDDDPAEFVDLLAAAYGSERLCWGSDHPQHQSMTYPEMVDLARRSAANLPPDERASFLGTNSLDLWW
ncbi:MAG: amidohydrolase [Microthrixaceae bacterium]|nr:amidohydrolase [Microthrixaceae bacterium]MCB1012374.1 amidohydrolase [Microthrixaceae bacterium]MCB9387335.1 amidohydrolase [Microthrixaceae bacterium]MCO5322315.1 amidohydrolase [Microthrixaceae bacterium]